MTLPVLSEVTTGFHSAVGDPTSAPVHVLQLDLAVPGSLRAPGGLPPESTHGRVLTLVRLDGHPIGWVRATVDHQDPDDLYRALADTARRGFPVPAPAVPAVELAHRRPDDGPLVSVIVCTRDRTPMLGACLDSILRLRYPHLEVILVDNAPASDATRELVRTRYGDRIRYLNEPVPGLSWARNHGLAAARGEICAFTDDDVIVDDAWVTALVDGFTTDARAACVTGLVAPAELDTEAQLTLEAYAPAGRGFTLRTWTLDGTDTDGLAQFSTGRFGSGASMAFRTDVLRGVGGFDRAAGAGSPARGGEDLLAFQQVLTAGHTVVYQPDAVVWHRHRRTMDALTRQISAFGVGFGAYLTAAVMRRPGLLLVLLRRLPSGVWRWHQAARKRTRGAPPGYQGAFRSLKRLERRGFLYGPFCYLVSLRTQRRAARTRAPG
ncbi:glycosyltransferase [Kitasatospora sp. NPDC101176]|uniref:glycosyltransferase n=1 Tax=Kitasatospora sp. NPDC101176 TaxID=3364099 RepID=UPI0038034649